MCVFDFKIRVFPFWIGHLVVCGTYSRMPEKLKQKFELTVVCGTHEKTLPLSSELLSPVNAEAVLDAQSTRFPS